MANTPTTKRTHDESDATQKDQSPAKRIVNINDFNNLVTVLVGPKEEQFTLHQDPVCAKSKFFKAACSKQWVEGQKKTVRLPDVKPATFKVYCSWVYSNTIAEPTGTANSSAHDKHAELKSIIELYLLGDKLDDILLRDHAKITLFKSMQNQSIIPGVDLLELIWESTPPASLFRKMIVDVYARRVTRNKFCESVSEYPREFLEAVAMASLQASPLVAWSEMTNDLSPYLEVEAPK